ncbi:protein ELYS isoform X2 [Ceratina calcarata]|uniref:Protein ELYS isoform X2 n=1 Tax=Ceratina calcarata TaxID=156304 RepID=A0AAJ7J005_9HYME|nr:protein ELYS isoform X2 [Ceratina calcarata]
MKELEEMSCEVRSVVDIRHSIVTRLNNVEDDNRQSNDSAPYNGFSDANGGLLSDVTYAWLSYGSHLIVINVKTGECTSSWTFRGKVSCVCQFPVQNRELPLLLVGLDNEATRIKDSIGVLCVFDCTSSRVLRAIKMPAGIEQVCIVSGGADWEEFNDKRPDNILMQMDGIACVVLRNLCHLMVDLRRSVWETPSDVSATMDETSPAEIEFLTSKDTFRNTDNKHMAFNLLNRRIEKHIGFNREDLEFLDEKLTNTIISSTKIGCLISGCLGRVIVWQNDGSVGWISMPVDETMIVTHLTLLEPTDDPRPFYYLWVVLQDESSKVPPLFRMFALLFERKYCDRGTNLYFNLEAEPSLKLEFELEPNDRVVSLSPIERAANPDQTESESRRGEDSLLLISTTNRTLLFDLNQWYKEQMPQAISECKNPNSILACYDTKHKPTGVTSEQIISCAYVPRTLQEFAGNSLNSLEELFYPNSLSLEWVELSTSKLTFWLSRGVQAELLREMALAGPIVLTQPTETFHKCLSVGLVPSNTEVSFASDLNTQRDMLLSLCLEQRWASFLIRCAREWSDGSAAYMYPSFLRWGIQRASSIKMIADRLCVPLFDQSGSNIGESEVRTLRFCYQQLECLSNVVAKLPTIETDTLTKQRRALKRVSMYFQVLLWFYDVGLLPESQNLEEGPLPISLALKIPYPFEKLSMLYNERREEIKGDATKPEDGEPLFIDELIARECPALNLQWEREAGDAATNGYYPPSSLQSLLRSYLTDCDQTESSEIECKHQITIYLLMDLAMLLQGSYPGVDQLIKYPSSFKMSPSLIKLTQAFWLLDHEDYHGFLDMVTGQLVNDSDVKDWHHKLVLRTLIRHDQHKLALMYLRVKKPPLSSLQEQSTLIDLSVEHGLVQSAFHRRPRSHYAQLLMCFFQACKNYDKLGHILHLALDPEEEDMFVKFLEDSKSEDVRLLYYLQRCRYMEANNGSSNCWFNAFGSRNVHLDMLNAYNATLPDVMKRFTANTAKASLDAGSEPRYPRPMTHYRSSQRTASIYETVIRKARETYVRNEKSAIPFVTAPCATLRSNNERIDVNCVMSPKILRAGRKRTLDQVTRDEKDSGIVTPDRAKRRKLLNDDEAAINAAFNTPLVKRKVSSKRDVQAETPHSILKIRQLIRNSTSPTVASLHGETSEGLKVGRQIRFDVSQQSRKSSQSEANVNEQVPKLDVSNEANEMFVGQVSDTSMMESTVLSESSYTCSNVFPARPRPSIRRSDHSVDQSLAKSTRPESCPLNSRSSGSPLTDSENSSRMISKTGGRRCTSLLSPSAFYSTAVLSSDSSFESASLPPKREINFRFSKTPQRQDTNRNHLPASTPKTTGRGSEGSWHASRKPMDDEEREDTIQETFYAAGEKVSDNLRRSNDFQFHSNEKSGEDTEIRYGNGKAKTSEVVDTEGEDNEETFESLSNANESSSYGKKDEERQLRRWSPPSNLDEKDASLTNRQHFDITDDESSSSSEDNDENHEEKQKQEQETIPLETEGIYDAANITDDESNSSIVIVEDVFEEVEESVVLKPDPTLSISEGRVRTVRSLRSRLSVKKEEVVERSEAKEDSISRDNNNSTGYRKTRRNSARDTPDRTETVDTSNVDSGSPRMTRSRRAVSTTKETKEASPASSPAKVPAIVTRSRRASSLAKEVLIASASTADESIKHASSLGSKESLVPSSPRRGRGKGSLSAAKDAPTETKDEQSEVPVRRITRHAASVQKEPSEPVKPSKGRSRTRSTSLTAEGEDGKTRTEAKGPKAKQTSKKTSRSRKESTSHEEDVKTSEEPSTLRPLTRRGSSMPKETVSISRSVRTRRAMSVTKDAISEEEFTRTVPDAKVNSPAANTRSRRLSIQSIPEELEEILSVPTKERQKGKPNLRQRRATSVESSQADTKKKTSTRSRGVLAETIMEEEATEAEIPADDEQLATRKVSTKRKRALSETTAQESNQGTASKPRRTRQTRQESKEKDASQFTFSDSPPLDQKVMRENVFSPPNTRSKATAADHRK